MISFKIDEDLLLDLDSLCNFLDLNRNKLLNKMVSMVVCNPFLYYKSLLTYNEHSCDTSRSLLRDLGY